MQAFGEPMRSMRPKRWMMRDGVPVDVVVDEVVAVLKVLTFGDAVGADENVDLARLVRKD